MMICPHGCKEFHITLDLDETKEPPSRLVHGNLLVSCTHWRLSAGGNGVHILSCVLPSDAVVVFDIVRWRYTNGDDKDRIEFDRQRFHETQDNRWLTGNLWDSKNGGTAGEWQDWHPHRDGRTRVVNISKTNDYDVYIGRGNGRLGLDRSIWANPFKLADSTRGKCIELYRAYIMSRQDLLARVGELKGKVLGC